MKTARIYKIFRVSEWQGFQMQEVFSGSRDDKRDGFIHLSNGKQTQGTVEKYFGNEPEIVIARFVTAVLEPDLKWEASRNGALFPHLFADLKIGQIDAHLTLAQKSGGGFDIDESFLDLT